MFESPPKHILYAYSVWQPAFDSLESEIPNIQFHEGLPSKEGLISWSKSVGHNHHKAVVLDDCMRSASMSSEIQDLFCVLSHHLNISCFYLTQNLFPPGK